MPTIESCYISTYAHTGEHTHASTHTHTHTHSHALASIRVYTGDEGFESGLTPRVPLWSAEALSVGGERWVSDALALDGGELEGKQQALIQEQWNSSPRAHPLLM